MPQRLLVADDTETLRQTVERALAAEGYKVLTAANGSDALLIARDSAPDLLLTDADMPGLDGHTLCKLLKRDKATARIPVVIMSGELMEEKDIIAGLDAGADDYITKPFQMKVLIARIRAVLRRFAQTPDQSRKLQRQGIVLDPGAREVSVQGRKVELTRKEFDLLALLIEGGGKVLSIHALLESVWGYDPADYNDPHTVETLVSRLRKKLGAGAAERIVNAHGLGYKFVSE